MGEATVHDIRTVLSVAFLRHTLNALSIPLQVQCAALDSQGDELVLADLPKPPQRLPYDLLQELVASGMLRMATVGELKARLKGVFADAARLGRARSLEFAWHNLNWTQFVSPVMVREKCVGFIATGMLPTGERKALESLADEVGAVTEDGSRRELARALCSVGVLPSTKIRNCLSLLVEQTRVVTDVATLSSRPHRRQLSSVKSMRAHMNALDAVVQALDKCEDEDSVLRIIVNEGFNLFGADYGTIHMWDPECQMLVVKAVEPASRSVTAKGAAYPPTQGISGWVFRNKRYALVRDLRAEPLWRERYHEVFAETRSELAVPLIRSKMPIGVLNLESEQADAFDEGHAAILRTLANHAVAALQRADLLKTKDRQLHAFAEAMSKLGPLYGLNETMETVVRQAAVALRGSVSSLKLYDDRKGTLDFRSTCAHGGERLKLGVPFPVWVPEGSGKDSVSAWTFRNQKSRLTWDTRKEALWRPPPWPARSAVHVPVLAGDRPIGVLAVDGPNPGTFAKEDVRVLELLARELAVAIENAWHDELVDRVGELLQEALSVPLDREPARHRARMLSSLTRIVWDIMKPKACSVIVPPLEGEDSRYMVIHEGCEYGINRQQAVPLLVGKGLYGSAIRSGQIQESDDVRKDTRFADSALAINNGLISALSVPIRKNGKSFGALNYYSGFPRTFSEFERHSLDTICGIAGMIISATISEKYRLLSILDNIGTGVTLIGIPPDLPERKRRREQGDVDWNLGIPMPLLFLNRVHTEIYCPRARTKMDCYKAFNGPAQERPCWWCPTIRAMMTGDRQTSFTHSPAPPKNRIEHFRVTASILRDADDVPFAAIESTVPSTRELEANNLSARLLEAEDEDKVLDLGAECLGRGTRNDCILFVTIDPGSKHLRIKRLYTVDETVLKRERERRPEWTHDTLTDEFPPVAQYFEEREQKGLRLFKERPHHRALRSPLSRMAAEIIHKSLKAQEVFIQIPTGQLLPLFAGTGLLDTKHFAKCEKDLPPRAVILRLGARTKTWGCLIMLDKRPGRVCFEEPGHGRHWCIEMVSQMATRIEGIRLGQAIKALARSRDAIIENAPVGIVMTDATGRVTLVNRTWRDMIHEDPTGKPLFGVTSLRRSGLSAEFRKVLRKEQVQAEQCRLRTTDGHDVILSVKCVPMVGRDGQVEGILIIGWDMTELVERHEELADAKGQLALAQLAAGTIHEIRLPAVTASLGARQAAQSLLGLLKEGRTLQAIPWRHEELSFLLNRIDRVCERVASGAKPLPTATRAAEEKTAASARDRGLRFRNNEIRTIARIGFADHLKELLSVGGGEYAGRIFSYLVRLSSFLTACSDTMHSAIHLNEVARAIELHKFIAPKRVRIADLHDTIELALIILQGEMDSASIAIRKKYSRRIPALRCVPGRLVQLWRNILQNGMESVRRARRRRDGSMTIQTSKSGSWAIVTIEDNGAGFPKSMDIPTAGMELPSIADGRVRGYGLWIARRIVEDHGGLLRIGAPRHAVGTKIVVKLPLRRRKSLFSAHQSKEIERCSE